VLIRAADGNVSGFADRREGIDLMRKRLPQTATAL
jgi:hypothetical protein